MKRKSGTKGKNTENWFGKNQHAGCGNTAVSAGTASQWGTERVIRKQNTNKTHRRQALNQDQSEDSRELQQLLKLRRQGLPTIYSGSDTLPPWLPSPCRFLHQRSPPLPPRLPLGATHPGCAALRAFLCPPYVPPGHEPFGCFEHPTVPLARLVINSCADPQ